MAGNQLPQAIDSLPSDTYHLTPAVPLYLSAHPIIFLSLIRCIPHPLNAHPSG